MPRLEKSAPDVSNTGPSPFSTPEIEHNTQHFCTRNTSSRSLLSYLRQTSTPQTCCTRLCFHFRSPSLFFWDPSSLHQPEEKDSSRLEVCSSYSLSGILLDGETSSHIIVFSTPGRPRSSSWIDLAQPLPVLVPGVPR